MTEQNFEQFETRDGEYIPINIKALTCFEAPWISWFAAWRSAMTQTLTQASFPTVRGKVWVSRGVPNFLLPNSDRLPLNEYS